MWSARKKWLKNTHTQLLSLPVCLDGCHEMIDLMFEFFFIEFIGVEWLNFMLRTPGDVLCKYAKYISRGFVCGFLLIFVVSLIVKVQNVCKSTLNQPKVGYSLLHICSYISGYVSFLNENTSLYILNPSVATPSIWQLNWLEESIQI